MKKVLFYLVFFALFVSLTAAAFLGMGSSYLYRNDILWMDSAAIETTLEESVDHELLRAALTRLSARDREIIAMRFGLCGLQPLTQKEVADKLGISQSYISRLEKRILEKLRADITHAWSA